jgi:hypothetical protein
MVKSDKFELPLVTRSQKFRRRRIEAATDTNLIHDIGAGLGSRRRDASGMWSERRPPHSEPTRGANERRETNIKIRVIIEGRAVAATLADNEAAREFASLLPLTLTLKDYADNEKISDLPKKLSTKGVPATYNPSTGDITYYAPWGNLALFHKDGHNSPGLIKLGKFDSGAELLRRPGALKATFERMKH